MWFLRLHHGKLSSCIARETAHRSISRRSRRTGRKRRNVITGSVPEPISDEAMRIEGTLSRGIRTCRLRQLRDIGLVTARLGHLLTAVALNFLRLGEWFADIPRAKTRRSPFVTLMAA